MSIVGYLEMHINTYSTYEVPHTTLMYVINFFQRKEEGRSSSMAGTWRLTINIRKCFILLNVGTRVALHLYDGLLGHVLEFGAPSCSVRLPPTSLPSAAKAEGGDATASLERPK